MTVSENDFAFKLAVETRHHSFKSGLKFRRCHILFWKTGCIVKTSGSLRGAKLHVTDLQKAHRRFIKVAPEKPAHILGLDETLLINSLLRAVEIIPFSEEPGIIGSSPASERVKNQSLKGVLRRFLLVPSLTCGLGLSILRYF